MQQLRQPSKITLCTEVYDMQISEPAGGVQEAGNEPCRFPKLEECAHFHYERVQLPQLTLTLQTSMDQSLHSQHTNDDDSADWHMVQVTSAEECWLVQRSYENFKMLDAQLHQCIYDRKISQLPDLSSHPSYGEDIETLLIQYLAKFTCIANNSVNCGPVLNWFQMDNKGHRLLVPSEESRSINTPAVAAAYSVRRYVSQARDELNLEVGDMISVIDMASPAESVWWRGKRGFQVGFFPQHCVHIIGDKVPRNMPLPPPVVGSLAITPVKPVLRKHGKLIAFFRSFILNRPSRRRLKQSGILKERVFGCDLGEHLLNSGHDIPTVLKCCSEFIEKHGIVDGIYRLSGVTSNIQKLRNAFDEDRVPDLYTEEILQDIHSVASLLKMYFRELPNPLCTYQLYQSFVHAVQGCNNVKRNSLTDHERLLKMREAVQKLPPPHYRTLEYLMRHLSRVAHYGPSTGMTTRNIAIVWAPNLLRCAELEVGGVAALQGVGVQAVVTEFLICYSDLIFCDRLPSLNNADFDIESSLSPKRCRPKSLAISTPTKLITLEEARTKHLLSKADDSGYIEVGGGPNTLPKKYHTIIELPAGSRKRSLSKRSPLGWRSFFSKSRSSSRSQGSLNKSRKASTPGSISTEKMITELDLSDMKRKLRPVKSAESLTSGHSEPASCEDVLGPLHCLNKPPGHNRSVSHDSYFDLLQNSQHNSEGSLYDLSEIQLNFELEESEMRIFSEDESLVSSPRVQKDAVHNRRILTRARPEDFSSTNNSNNPSPKKQARVVLSPDLNSRKRTRLEDQLSDIQYIDCNTPDNMCVVSTTAMIHSQPEPTFVELYQPKNKSPRSSEISTKRQSLDFEKCQKPNISKSFTESNLQSKLGIPSNQSSAITSPQSPLYNRFDNSSSNTTPDDNTPLEVEYQNLNQYPSQVPKENDSKSVYENIVSPVSKKSSPTYENVLTTISITYKSPTKSSKNSIVQDDSVYENICILNPEQAMVPTSSASLPLQQASQPHFQKSLSSLPTNITNLNLPDKTEQRPKSLSALEDLNKCEVETRQDNLFNNHSESDHKSTSLNLLSQGSPILSACNMESSTDLSLSEVLHSSTEVLNTSQSSLSFPNNSVSPNVSPMLYDETKTLSQEILSSLSPSVASLLDMRTGDSSGCSFDDKSISICDNEDLTNARYGNPEYLKLTENISLNDEDVCAVESNSNTMDDIVSDIVELKSEKEEVKKIQPNNLNIQSDSDNRKSVNLIEFSPVADEPNNSNLNNANDTRKLPESEPMEADSHVYQQVKYFRSSIHEINALLDLQESSFDPALEIKPTIDDNLKIDAEMDNNSEAENFDSLEVNNVHIYENVDSSDNSNNSTLDSKTLPVTSAPSSRDENVQKPNVRSLTSRFEMKESHDKPPIFKRNDSQKSVKSDSSKVKVKEEEGDRVQKIVYDRDGLPPCLRARQLKNAIKTRSLDEDEFTKEFGSLQSERRKSVDENFGSKLVPLPKILNQPKPIPTEGEKLLHLAHSSDNINAAAPEQKLNRERIERYKEERRKILHEKYRSESFKEDKDILLSRFKHKGGKGKAGENEIALGRTFSSDPGPYMELLKIGTKGKNCENESKVPKNEIVNEFSGDSLECDNNLDQTKSQDDKEVKEPFNDFRESIRYRTALFESQLNQSKQLPDGKSFICDKSVGKPTDSNNKINNAKKVQEFKSPLNVRKIVKESNVDILKSGDDFIRNKKIDDDFSKNERRRHTYESKERERESEADVIRRISLENRSPRKDTKSPSYCIKDMKAIFESKSQQ